MTMFWIGTQPGPAFTMSPPLPSTRKVSVVVEIASTSAEASESMLLPLPVRLITSTSVMTPFGSVVKSTCTSAPSIRSVSVPAPPPTLVSVGSQIMVSSPSPPFRISLPTPPLSVSLPPLPIRSVGLAGAGEHIGTVVADDEEAVCNRCGIHVDRRYAPSNLPPHWQFPPARCW